MTLLARSEDAFEVEYSVEASRQLSCLPNAVARLVEDAVGRLARVASLLPVPSASLLRRTGIEGAGAHLVVGEWAVAYEVSPLRRTVTLTEVMPRGLSSDAVPGPR